MSINLLETVVEVKLQANKNLCSLEDKFLKKFDFWKNKFFFLIFLTRLRVDNR